LVQRFAQGEQLICRRFDLGQRFLQITSLASTPVLRAALAASVFDKNATHGFGGHGFAGSGVAS
jgi:hypothetical protein